jgi:hypothetical protein
MTTRDNDDRQHDRNESNGTTAIPLGVPLNIRPERGPDTINYYRAKHRDRKVMGKFWPLHITAPLRRH